MYGTGNALTLAQSTYSVGNPTYGLNTDQGTFAQGYYYQDAELYGAKNSFRMHAYHRLDLGATFTKPVKHGERLWQVGLYNAYSRHNPYYVYYQVEYYQERRPDQKRFYQLSLFPILPAVSYERSF